MATRRMFSKVITNSSRFLMMPQSSQNLYFHLGMNADDDGFVEHFTVMRMTESKPDDLKVLQMKELVHVFDDKVLMVSDWKENNYLRSDRYTPSKYLQMYKEEIKALSSGIPSVDHMETQVRLELGKDRVENTGKAPAVAEAKEKKSKKETFLQGDQWNELIDAFKPLNDLYRDFYSNKTERAALDHLARSIGLVKLLKAIQFAVSCLDDEFAPTITKPSELKRHYGRLQKHYKKVAKRKS